MNERIRAIIDKIPINLIMFVLLAYKGYDVYVFMNDPQSDLNQRVATIEELQGDMQKLELRVKEIEKFKLTLDQKRESLRTIAQELENLKTSLGSEIDVPAFIKMVTTEARKLGMSVGSIRPAAVLQRDLYNEQAFEISFKGIYVQLLVFLQRLSKMQNIVRIESMDMRPMNNNASVTAKRYVDLDGRIQIKAYSYRAPVAEEKKPAAPGAKQ